MKDKGDRMICQEVRSVRKEIRSLKFAIQSLRQPLRYLIVAVVLGFCVLICVKGR